MKTKITFLILVAFTFSFSVKAQLAGKKFELKMEQMGTFYIDFQETAFFLTNPMGQVAVKGTYKTENGIILLTDKEGPMACQEKNVGKYRFTCQNKELKMELIEDNCTGRPGMMTQV